MIDVINFQKPATGSFLVDVILWLVQISSSVTLGVVLFTVLLKLITLPFDFFSRASMRKNSLRMEKMRPELEKLQKQYADNKQLYNQKMMALYKKNGYSMFGACLPTILTLVIFIVAINAFTSYSKFQNQQYFYNMSQSYNNVIYSGMDLDDTYVKQGDNGELIIDAKALWAEYKNGNTEVATNKGHKILLTKEGEGKDAHLVVATTNGYVKCHFPIVEDKPTEPRKWSVNKDNLKEGNPLANEENNYLKIYKDGEWVEFDKAGKSAEQFVNDICQEKSAETYRNENEQFLWIKNIWVTDSPTKHPVESSWETFKSTHGYSSDKEFGEENYNKLVAKLEYEKTAPNGYFIMVVITAGISFLMQIVMGKSQKAQMELQTVDGQGAQTQRIMKWVMPIMMAVFSFMYTAAFSIYIVISNVLSIGTTYGINYIVDRRFKKKEGEQETEVIRGRVYTPKPEEKAEPKKQDKKKSKAKEEQEKGDFLSGTADKKHIRGRIK